MIANLVVSKFTRLEQLATDDVSIDYRDAKRRKQLADGGFTRCDASRKSNSKHVIRAA
jgi:hypothetical protein